MAESLNITSRRNLLGVAAAVPVAALAICTHAKAGAAATSALVAGGPLGISLASHPDGAIGEMLILWSRAVLRGMEEGERTTDIGFCCDKYAEPIRNELLATPATTVEGLAIKSYVAIHCELGGDYSALDINYEGGLMNDTRHSRALIADCLRLSPLLSAVVSGESGRA